MYKKTAAIIMILLLFVTVVTVAADETESNQAENVAAVVNGETITMNELNSFVDANSLLRNLFQVDQLFAQIIFGSEAGQEVLKKYRENKLEQLILNKLLIDKAHEEISMTQTEKDETFNNHIKEIKENNDLTDEEVLNELKNQGLGSFEQYKTIYLNQLIFDKFQQKVMSEATISEEEVKDYYENNKSEFEYNESVDVSHILFRTDERSEEEAKAEAEKIINKLEAGEDFAELAKEFSESPSAENGGEIGYINKSDTSFASTVFDMEVGEISAPIKTGNGYEVIKVNDKKEAGVEPFSEVKDSIESSLLKSKKEQTWEKFVRKLRDEAEIEIKL